MSESPPPPAAQPLGILPAAIDLANVLATLRYPDMSSLWRLGGQPLEHAYAQLQQALSAVPWYARGRKADLRARLDVVNLELADAKQAQRRLQTVLHA